LIAAPGTYRFRYLNQGRGAAYLAEWADDLAEALALGRELAEHRPDVLPPLGPTGRRKTRRGAMFKHNLKIAAKRRRLVNKD
jgi:hypothetical protein